jgi:putative NADH-flavin reductase
MRIAVFGASEATGSKLTGASLSAGHNVTALRNIDAVRKTVADADAVLSALGARTLGPDDVPEKASPLMVQAMNEAGIRRIISLFWGLLALWRTA